MNPQHPVILSQRTLAGVENVDNPEASHHFHKEYAIPHPILQLSRDYGSPANMNAAQKNGWAYPDSLKSWRARRSESSFP